MKNVVLIICCLVCYLNLNGQSSTYEYTYDNAGNRISRLIIPLEQAFNESAAELDNSSERTTELQERKYTDYLDGQEITIYPNPTLGDLYIEVTGEEETKEVDLSLYSINGNLIHVTKLKENVSRLSMSDLPSGEYIMWIEIDGKSKSFKIIKK